MTESTVGKEKRSVEDLALFGGARLFDRPRSIGQLHKPPFDTFRRKLREIYAARTLSNDGPLVRQLEQMLAAHHRVRHAIALTNAGLGIMMLMRLFANGRRGEVVMPSFTFRGLPHFAIWAGQTPNYCEVDPLSHTLDPAALRQRITGNVTSILAVANAYSPGDRESLCAVAQELEIPIFFDSVYGFGSTYRGCPLGGWGSAEVFSLHATKALNGFEGGYVTTNDDHLADLLRLQRNFSLTSLPHLADENPQALGLNAKLNELHAAMALVCFDDLPELFDRNRRRYKHYAERLAGCLDLSLVDYPSHGGDLQNYQMILASIGEDLILRRDDLVKLLRAEGMSVSAYYGPALHLSNHSPPTAKVGDLSLTEKLAAEIVQLPAGDMVSIADINAITDFLLFVFRHAGEIGNRMAARRQPHMAGS